MLCQVIFSLCLAQMVPANQPIIGVVSSLVNSTPGTVTVFGVDITQDRSKAMSLIGLVPQEINFNMFEKPIDILVNYAGFLRRATC